MDEEEMMRQQVLQQAADSGRATDTVLAHLTIGEVVIPAELMNDPEVAQIIEAVFQAYGIDPGEYTVGHPENKINPETGYPEFFLGRFFKGLKRVFKKVAPIALPILGTMIPGVGTVLGGALGGALGGLASGKGLKGALTGGALGGLGGYFSGPTGLVGSSAGTSLDVVKGVQGLQGPTLGSGIKGALSGGGLKALGAGFSTGNTFGNLVKPAASLYSSFQDDNALEKARNAQLDALNKASGALSPYNQTALDAQKELSSRLSAGFSPGDLTGTEDYKFRYNQGLDALNRTMAAQGMGNSGSALKAAQEYGQNMAANEYSNAYDRWAAQNNQLSALGGQGPGVASTIADTRAGMGDVNSAYLMEAQKAKTKRLQEILAGLGY